MGELLSHPNPNPPSQERERECCHSDVPYVPRSTGAAVWTMPAYSGMGRFHKHQGNTAQAREYLTDALEIFERLGTLIEPDKVRKELADLP
jgi:hypothetical protein